MKKIVARIFVLMLTICLISLLTTQLAESFNTTQHNQYLPMLRIDCPDGRLSGIVFHDTNGDGIQNISYEQGLLVDHPDGQLGAVGPLDETPIAGVQIKLNNQSIFTTSKGFFQICLAQGVYDVEVIKSPYRFYFPDDLSVVELSKTISIQVEHNTVRNFGLGVGLFTLPYSLEDSGDIIQEVYTDIDPITSEAGIFNIYPCTSQFCEDGHRGVDYHIPEGNVVRALAPGFIFSVGAATDGSLMIVEVYTQYEDLTPWEQDQYIHWSGQGIESSYQHLATAVDGIVPGVFVKRGQPLAYISDHNHLHIDAHQDHWQNNGYVDLYRDTFHSELVFFYHPVDNVKISQGSPGYWTVDNRPHFPAE